MDDSFSVRVKLETATKAVKKPVQRQTALCGLILSQVTGDLSEPVKEIKIPERLSELIVQLFEMENVKCRYSKGKILMEDTKSRQAHFREIFRTQACRDFQEKLKEEAREVDREQQLQKKELEIYMKRISCPENDPMALDAAKAREGGMLTEDAAGLVGRILSLSQYYGDYPCHRVVNQAGRTAPCFRDQRERLEAEGVTFLPNGNVDMKKHQWEC